MIVIEGVLVSDEVVSSFFLCNLNACKGACCWEGDYGAPLEKTELEVLDRIYPQIKDFLSQEGRTTLETAWRYTYYEEAEEYGTPLLDNGACAYLTYDANGIGQCGIEKAFNAGATDFKKPVSCHLYPIRVSRNEQTGFESLNYDRWGICSPACAAGAREQLPLYRFLREAIIRKYGESFYEALDGAARWKKT